MKRTIIQRCVALAYQYGTSTLTVSIYPVAELYTVNFHHKSIGYQDMPRLIKTVNCYLASRRNSNTSYDGNVTIPSSSVRACLHDDHIWRWYTCISVQASGQCATGIVERVTTYRPVMAKNAYITHFWLSSI
eukprot:TRINITY_DN2560_c0_g1_i1.p2 TRINITY_DN2560_c0_g1~~TRINITY_DN2560_c0_g1_i1.p2  ORF type:complete len:132 (-),score=2.67 TRINITY_DN2560_c0_g1_i1:547-942(-)